MLFHLAKFFLKGSNPLSTLCEVSSSLKRLASLSIMNSKKLPINNLVLWICLCYGIRVIKVVSRTPKCNFSIYSSISGAQEQGWHGAQKIFNINYIYYRGFLHGGNCTLFPPLLASTQSCPSTCRQLRNPLYYIHTSFRDQEQDKSLMVISR